MDEVYMILYEKGNSEISLKQYYSILEEQCTKTEAFSDYRKAWWLMLAKIRLTLKKRYRDTSLRENYNH
jgi:hypothetical protein